MILSLRQVVNIGCIAAALLCSANLSVAEQEIPLHSFCDPTLQAECGATGAGAQGLIRDNAGNYYGVAGFEGTQAAGAIYSWSSSSGYNQLYSFCHEPCQEGDGPQGLLVLDANGNLYGTTTDGGSLAVEDPPGYGVVYKLSVSAPSQYFHLWDFCKIDLNCPEGSHPTAGLTYVGAASGNLYDGTSPLYGVTRSGGTYGKGTVFKIMPGGAPAVIAEFCSAGSSCLHGQMPNAVIADSNGNLYGTTQLGPDGPGGRQSTAAIFYKLTWTGSSYSQSVLHTFCSQPNCADGQQPLGPLTLDSSGAILGTTEFGGLNNQGTIFQYPRSFFVVYSFCASGSCTDGSNPMGGVIIAADGSLYGTTNVGGDNGRGVVFKLGTGYQVLYSFCPLTPQHACLNNGGANPQAGVLVDGSGDIFGTTANGGQYGSPTFGGELFELTP